jgi:hypothetical protein
MVTRTIALPLTIALPGRFMTKLPNADLALIEVEKIRDYLLNLDHPEGGPKAAFFHLQGFERARWELLAAALKDHALRGHARFSKERRGRRSWEVDGLLETPSGKWPLVRAIWVIENYSVPRLVSAYPR